MFKTDSGFQTRKRSIVVAANRIPVSIRLKDKDCELVNSPGGLVSALKSVKMNMDWIGWPGAEIPTETRKDFDGKIALTHGQFSLRPVHISQAEEKKYYSGISNSLIWPVFHSLPHLSSFSHDHWQAYQAINLRFANELLCSIHDRVEQGEKMILAWVHDYQLMLVPTMLRSMIQKNPFFRSVTVKIGFFLHIPFPDVFNFSTLPSFVQRELIKGVLGSNLIGFHEQSYLSNFVANTRECFPRLQFRGLGPITQRDHTAHLRVYPIGIEPAQFDRALEAVNDPSRAHEILDEYHDSKLVLGVDRLDPSKGLIEKLKGFEAYLEKNPDMRGKVSLLQVAVPSRESIKEYADLRISLLAEAERINARYSVQGRPKAINVIFDNFQISELAIFYRATDALLITSLQDGMNLVSFEYSICAESRGVLILSRTTGAAKYLRGSLLVDPTEPLQIADQIQLALDMKPSERETRMEQNVSFIRQETAQAWAERFIGDLENSNEKITIQ